MLVGIGSIILRSGRRLPVKYEFGSHPDHLWVGYLILDVARIDPSEFSDKVLLHCDGGSAVELAVTGWTDQCMAVVGRPLPELDWAA